MNDFSFLQQLGVMVVAAAALLLLLRRLGAPSIVIYVGTGLLLGSISRRLPFQEIARTSESLDLLAEAGIILLLFLVGLELHLSAVKDLGRGVLIAGFAQVLVTAAVMYGLAAWIGYESSEAIFFAAAFTFSSTVLVVKLLDSLKDTASYYGRLALGILIVQDLMVVLALTLFGSSPGEAGMTPADLGKMILLSLGGAMVLGAATIGLAAKPLAPLFRWAARDRETLLILSLAWCFAAVIGAELLHLSAEIGAFLAGVGLAQLPSSLELSGRLQPLMNFLVALFFLILGFSLDFGSAAAELPRALIFIAAILLLKPFLILLILARTGYGQEVSFRTAISLAQISEFSFVLAGAAMANGFIGAPAVAVVSLVGLVTIATSSYLLLYNRQIYEWMKGFRILNLLAPKHNDGQRTPSTETLSGHVVVVGMNTLGRQIVRMLDQRGIQVVAVDTDPGKLAGLPGRHIVGSVDLPRVVEEVGLEGAQLVVSALRIEDTNNLLAYRAALAGVPSAIHAFDRSVIEELQTLGVQFLIDPRTQGSVRMEKRLLEISGAAT